MTPAADRMYPVAGTQIFGERPPTQQKPDRCAAAICTRVRPDWMFRGYSVGESCRVSVMRKGVTDPQSLSGRLEILAERYFFFFFLVVFFAFFAFFAFLAMLPSVVPKKVAFMQVDIDVHAFRVHDDCKIDIAHFKEGKRTPRRRDFRSANLLRDAWMWRAESCSTLQRLLCVESTRPQINLHAAAA